MDPSDVPEGRFEGVDADRNSSGPSMSSTNSQGRVIDPGTHFEEGPRTSNRVGDVGMGNSHAASRRRAHEQGFQHELEMMKAREQRETNSHTSGKPPSNDVQSTGLVAAHAGSHSTGASRPSLEGISRVENGRRYRLVVVQHPSRARMCGFGDKDRRPLSPTLIVKLVITDEATGAEISPLEVNTSLSLLATDLCNPDDLSLASRNILVHHQATSLPQLNSTAQGQAMSRQGDVSYRSSAAFGSSLTNNTASDAEGHSNGHTVSPGSHSARGDSIAEHGRGQQGGPMVAVVQAGAESYTRNLVGAAVASASVLKDEEDKWCTFFVLQDISVRTEGVYRIKLMYVNLEVNGRVSTGVSEALAEVYTDLFTVYSPRRFPGMLDPTPLSRKLASQGIKIPVRNDKKKRKQADDGDAGGDDDGGSGGDDDDE